MTNSRIAWWQQARFGIFVHWGLYAIPGRGEWNRLQENVPVDEYAKLAEEFTPDAFDPRKWVRTARDAGAGYVVLTTRHHDGFCLFDSAASDFTAPQSACGRDLIAEFADACHTEGMRMGFYYSLLDWHFPFAVPASTHYEDSVYAPTVEQAHAQVRELLTNYGKVDILWYDGMAHGDASLWRSVELNTMARELQPDILINNRAGTDEDFGTPENVIKPDARPWEACYTMNDTWGYAPGDTNYKPAGELIRLLTSCAAQAGNLLLNIGPDPSGRFPRETTDRLAEVGAWMKRNGKAIRGSERSPISAPALGWGTRVGNLVYLLIWRWPGGTLPFAWCGSRATRARLLTDGRMLRVEQEGDRVWLHGLPSECPEPTGVAAIELAFDGEPKASDPPMS